MRLQQSMGNLFRNRMATARTDIPSHTDIDVPVSYWQTMHVRFGQQEGRRNGCRNEFQFRVLEVDHITPSRVVARTTSTTCNYCIKDGEKMYPPGGPISGFGLLQFAPQSQINETFGE